MSNEKDHCAACREMLETVLSELAEIKETLASHQQRPFSGMAQQDSDTQTLIQRVKDALADGDVDRADRLLSPSIQRNFPEEFAELSDKIAGIKNDRAMSVIRTQQKHVTDLMSVARFDEAMEAAQQLKKQFPEMAETSGLLGRVQRESQTYQSEQRNRLFEIIREHGQARHWNKALTATYKLLEEYPDSPEAAEVQKLMSTIVDNARIEEVRQYRDRISDMIQRHRYAEAVDLARTVVQNYPETAAAEELRMAIPKFMELAQQSPPAGQ